MEILKLTEKDNEEIVYLVAQALLKGGLIVYPTETVYGLGVDATNKKAVEKLWMFKGKRENKPVLVAVNGEKMAEEYVEINDLGKKLIHKYWPGPVSILAVSKDKVAKKVQGEKETLGLRMPDNKFVLDLISNLGRPITSTSANLSGEKVCGSIDDFLRTVPEGHMKLVDYFIDGGTIENKLPSTIVDSSRGAVDILRQGDIEIDIV